MKFLGLILLFISFNLFATDSVRIYDTSDMTVTGTTNSNFTLYSSAPSGDATSSSAPAKVYLPMQSTISSVDNTKYFRLNIGSTSYTLFKFGSSSDFTSYVINLPLKVNIGTSTEYLYAAVKMPSSTSYTVFNRYSASGMTNKTDESLTFSIAPDSMCGKLTSETTNCSLFDQDGTQTDGTRTFSVYLFLSTSSSLLDATVDSLPNTYTNGIYFEINMSNHFSTSSTLAVTLNDPIRKGDQRVTGTFSTGSTMNNFKGAYAFLHDSSTSCALSKTDSCAADRSLSTCSGTIISDAVATAQSSDFTLPGLTNGCIYLVSIGLQDNYGFFSALSNSVSATPTQIEELLKKQSCFLLTAGFGEENYVIDYFRHFRDQTLSKYFLGKVFIKNYYKYAPSFALSIYNNQPIRFAIRMSAYFLYFVFNYFYLVLLFVVVNFAIFRKNKTKVFKF